MDSQIIAALITGVFGLITGVAVSKADSIHFNFLVKGRKLRRNWRGFTQRIAIENNKPLNLTYFLISYPWHMS